MKLGHRQQYYPKCLNHVFNAKALLESPFNQEKALVGAFFRDCENFAEDSFEALECTIVLC